MILLDFDELSVLPKLMTHNIATRPEVVAIAQAKKILIKLQAIYNIPDLGAENKRMGEFIQSLQEEVDGQ